MNSFQKNFFLFVMVTFVGVTTEKLDSFVHGRFLDQRPNGRKQSTDKIRSDLQSETSNDRIYRHYSIRVNDNGIEDGIPAWLSDQDGIKIPFQDEWKTIRFLSPSLFDQYGISVVPVDNSSRQQSLNEWSEKLGEFLLSRWHKHKRSRSGSGQIQSPGWTSRDSCEDCGMSIFPRLTLSNGSDLFLYDVFEPSLDQPGDQYNHSESDLPVGCYFKDNNTAYVVCNNSSLTSIPTQLPRDLIVFEMNQTNVTSIPYKAFQGSSISFMKLDGNTITWISNGAFEDIHGLLYLSLADNEVERFHYSMFTGLTSLIVLKLQQNHIQFNASTALQPENNSTILPSLRYLNLADNPLGTINEFTFWHLRHSPIVDINLKSCRLHSIHPNAFNHLLHLKHVDFFNNPGLKTIFSSNLPPNLPNLRQLGLGLLEYSQLPNAMIENMSDSLEVLNLSGNFLLEITWESLPKNMTSLKILILDNCAIYAIEEDSFRGMPNLIYLSLGKNKLSRIGNNAFPSTLLVLSLRQNSMYLSHVHDGKFILNDNNFANMTNLFWLDLNQMNLASLSMQAFSGLRNLRILQMRNSGIDSIQGLTFSSLNQLFYLDLGSNRGLHTLDSNFSLGLNQLRILFLDGCSLDFPAIHQLSTDADSIPAVPLPFAHLEQLKLLYLGRNDIHQIYPELFHDLKELSILDMSFNQLTTWPINSSVFFPDEMAVDLSNNRMTYLYNGTLDEFSRFWAIDLSSNAFLCHCQLRELQLLAEESNVTVLNWNKEGAYRCTDTSTGTPVIKIIPKMTTDELICSNEQPVNPTEDPGNGAGNLKPISSITVYIVSAVCLTAVILSTATCYYKRWHFRYAWFHLNLKLHRFKSCSSNSGSFQYDAFISFNEKDRQWVYTQLVPQLEGSHFISPDDLNANPGKDKNKSFTQFRLCLHDRDFTAGQRVTENIIDCICKSRKVVIVLSKAYVESKWCMYELHLAQHRLTEEGRNALVLIILENVPKTILHSSLRYLMATRTYLQWKNDNEAQKLFWSRLRQVLGADEILSN